MSISVKDIQNFKAFRLDTACGALKVWALSVGVMKRYGEEASLFDWDERRKLIEFIALIATRVNPDDNREKGNKLISSELECLLEEDLDTFAKLFLEYHPELYKKASSQLNESDRSVTQDLVDYPILSEETPRTYLLRLLDEYPRRIATSVMTNFSEMTKGYLAENSRLARQLKASLSAVDQPTEQLLIQDHRTTGIARPLNVLTDLNKQSIDLISNLNEVVRSIALDLTENAQQTQKSTGDAITIAKWSLVVAAISLVVALIFSMLSYFK